MNCDSLMHWYGMVTNYGKVQFYQKKKMLKIAVTGFLELQVKGIFYDLCLRT